MPQQKFYLSIILNKINIIKHNHYFNVLVSKITPIKKLRQFTKKKYKKILNSSQEDTDDSNRSILKKFKKIKKKSWFTEKSKEHNVKFAKVPFSSIHENIGKMIQKDQTP